MTAFADLPHDVRAKVRDEVSAIGGEMIQYHGQGVTVRLPKGATQDIVAVFERIDFEPLDFIGGPYWYFPVMHQATPKLLRWDASYPGSMGFTCQAHFVQRKGGTVV